MEKRGPRVLLVDEEESSLQTLSVVLSPAGYTVYPVRNGKEALRRVQSIRPDLILLDFGLSDANTKQVIKRLREWAIAPIIVMSISNEESEKVRSLDMGAHDYVTKAVFRAGVTGANACNLAQCKRNPDRRLYRERPQSRLGPARSVCWRDFGEADGDRV
jgi:CheY-like chemotaxis protein